MSADKSTFPVPAEYTGEALGPDSPEAVFGLPAESAEVQLEAPTVLEPEIQNHEAAAEAPRQEIETLYAQEAAPARIPSQRQPEAAPAAGWPETAKGAQYGQHFGQQIIRGLRAPVLERYGDRNTLL